MPEPEYNLSCHLSNVTRFTSGQTPLVSGEAECLDKWTLQEARLHFIAIATADLCAVAFLPDKAGVALAIKSGEKHLRALLAKEGVPLCRLPFSERKRFFDQLHGGEIDKLSSQLQKLYDDSRPLLEMLCLNRMPLPGSLRAIGERALTEKIKIVIKSIVLSSTIDARQITETREIFRQGETAGLHVNKAASSRLLAATLAEKIEDLMTELSLEKVEEILQLLLFIRKFEFTLDNWDLLLDRYWRILHLAPRPTPTSRTIVDAMRELGKELGFHHDVIVKLTRTLFSIAV